MRERFRARAAYLSPSTWASLTKRTSRIPELSISSTIQGISVKKQSTNIILVASLISPDNTFDSLFLSNYGSIRLRDELSRVKGVGDVTVSGAGAYSMRIWVDPTKLDARGLTFQDVLIQLRQQNVQVAAGQIGQLYRQFALLTPNGNHFVI